MVGASEKFSFLENSVRNRSVKYCIFYFAVLCALMVLKRNMCLAQKWKKKTNSQDRNRTNIGNSLPGAILLGSQPAAANPRALPEKIIMVIHMVERRCPR